MENAMTPLSDFEVLILAGGLGSRLGARTETMPKCLLALGGETLLDRSLDCLASHGVRQVHIVTGHRREAIETHLAQGGARSLDVRLHFNPDYRDGGSASSLAVGIARMPRQAPLLLLESDLLYDSAFLERAAACAFSCVLTADVSGSGDEVYVYTDMTGRLRDLKKRRQGPPPSWSCENGEFSGITVLSPRSSTDLARLASITNRGDYEELLIQASDTAPIAVRHCAGLMWCEIDTERDLQRARLKARAAAGHPHPLLSI